MKRIIILIPMLLWFAISFAQSFKLQSQAGFGATMVNVKKVIGDQLSNYNTYSYEFLLQGLLKSKHDKFRWMPEIGIQRLYYWEEEYFAFTPDPSPRWRSGTIWTVHGGLGIERPIYNYGYFQTGANVRYFLDGSGIAPGLMAGVGLKYHVSAKIEIPLGVRLDVVFGNATPSSFCVCTGLCFGKREH